jgi:hypothetical protein
MDANRSPGEGGGIGGHAEGKEISTFNKSVISISQYSLKVKSGAQAHWLLAEMGLPDHPQTVWTELDPVDYRLEQISSSGIGQQALPQALCFSHDAGISADGSPVRRAWACRPS